VYADQIGLGDQQPVGKRHLLHRFILMVELMKRIGGIDRRHDGIEPQEMRDQWIVQQSCTIGAGSARPVSRREYAKWRNLAAIAFHQECAQRLLEVAADCAANTTAREYRHLAIERSTRRWSRLTSPYSLMTTALSLMASWRSTRLSSVVLPLPRKPVINDTGSRSADLSFSNRLIGALTFNRLIFVAGQQPSGGGACRK
jgi:hypothetical protein